MPTILDRRASYQSQQQQTSPLSSPSLTPQNQQSLQQQQNRFWDDDQADPEHGPESRFTNVDFSPAASKSPASSRVHRSGETASLANAECSPTSCSPSSTAAVAATAATAQPPPPAASKRRSASVTLKNGATVKLPSKPADPLLNKEQCSINPSSVSSNSICQHFPCHMKQSTATTKHSSSSSNASPYHNNSKKSNAVSANNPGIGPLGSVPGNATSTATERRSRSLRSQRKRLIKEAKSEYEERVEMYYQQLTVGCGHVSCQNRFCASSKGGIRNLHPQAALVMAIQLASKPEDRLCHHIYQRHHDHHNHHHHHNHHLHHHNSALPPSDTVATPKKQHQPHDNAQKGKSAHTPKPFLQSLFSSSSFIYLFGSEAQQQSWAGHHSSSKSENKTKSVSTIPRKSASNHQQQQRAAKLTRHARHHHVSNNSKSTYAPFCGSSKALGLHMCPESSLGAEQDETDDSDFYYQIDNSDTSSLSSYGSRSSDTSDEGLSLAIKATAIDLKTALDKLNFDQEDQVKRWIRSVFQNWDGIGNSFLTMNEEKTAKKYKYSGYTAQLVDLKDVESFFLSVLHRHFSTISITDILTESIETLLDRMNLNAESVATVDVDAHEIDSFHVKSAVEWARSLICAFEWIQQRQSFSADDFSEKGTDEFCNKLDGNATITWLPVLSHKYIQVLSKLSSRKQSLVRQILIDMLSSLDASHMRQRVSFLQQYLSDHFHTGPYKHGENDPVVMAVKSLELLYQANLGRTPNGPIIPLNEFCNHNICKKLNIRNEYRIWKRVLEHGEGRHSVSAIAASQPAAINRYGGLSEQQSRTRLFLTTTSTSILLPYPFANEYQFSWFSYPFLLPAVVKRKILHMDAMSQMSAEYEDACVNHTLVVHAQRLLSDAPSMVRNLEMNLKSATCPYLLLEIRRENFVNDAFHQVSQQWTNIKKPLKVKFIEGGEEGMDQGGVQKEFFGVLFEKLLSKETGLFDFDPETRLSWIRRVVAPDLRSYEMAGVMMGLAIYNGVIMNIQFPYLLWKVLVLPTESAIDEKADKHELFTLQDLQEGWPSLASGLQQLLDWPDEVQDVFCRNYEITLDIFGKGIKTIPLIEGGENIPVTNANRVSFVRDYCTYFLYKAQRDQLLAIRRGVWSVIGGQAMDLCTADVLQVIACGQQEGPDILDLDMSELEAVTDYDDGYSASHPVIRNFWSIVHDDLTPEQKRKLLLFVTASDRVPVGGLRELSFVLQRNGPDSDRLPTALTCFSRLLLPEYSSREKLKERLITAIENAKGFGLV